ncbi:hypothetical protein AYO44_05850 [Planctomycetaceae bacterium SCGC AG-212-F19]|nr:hypothetical protein AYO44_05850 [Planctomycetaceae bacterium SCGC AG-212-F19]
MLAHEAESNSIQQAFTLDSGDRLATAVTATPTVVRVRFVCDADAPLTLHWGLAGRFPHEWTVPPEELQPAGTIPVASQAARTPFILRRGMQWLELEFRKPADGPGPRGMRFVLYQTEGNAWLKCRGKDIYIPLFEGEPDARLPFPRLRELAEEIVGVEVGAPSWTLMHRFTMCHELLGKAETDAEALALLFVWLRYSATRQLDWQRSYNTKPRQLSHAQDRLTRRLAGIWKRSQSAKARQCRLLARLMLTTLGRGGEGQQVRDEILHIMHRNHLREVSHTFVEEWHQKLHNNTTPDDVAICEAYLAFLKANGDREAFYRTLQDRGVTRERLQKFERPIKADPQNYPDRREALVRDFENFLRILKSVHSGTDLETAAGVARKHLDGQASQTIDLVCCLRGRNAGAGELAETAASAREELARLLAAKDDDGALRDLLFLDLALEDTLRGAIEREKLSQLERDRLVELVHIGLRNLVRSVDSEELGLCARHWAALLPLPREGREWALHARSVADRTARWIQSFTAEFYQQLQPKAEFLGEACAVEKWVVPLFGEEVIRGGPAFPLGLLLRHLDPILRRAAGLGGWQFVSRGQAVGRVIVGERLLAFQHDRFPEAAVIVADTITGDEEIPAGVQAVITTDTPDLLSHVAVRARNAGILLATCYDREVYEQLKNLKGKIVSLLVTPGGDVDYCETTAGMPNAPASTKERGGTVPRRSVKDYPGWVVTGDQFTPEIVGGKSNNLNGLRGRLPEGISLPTSIALPFGVFERTLADQSNRELRGRYENLLGTADQNPTAVLAQLRTLLLDLEAPAVLKESLPVAWEQAGLPPIPWEQAWGRIRRVWASKWNERAYLSRRERGLAHEDLRMAVLIQEVIPADYAFVVHTANPLTGSSAEVFAEVVFGLGETLVGNYPGRALGFTWHKARQQLDILSYPSKSVGLYGRGVIFRSDSNGEDLQDFAGAGLYDSFLAEAPEERALDYTGAKLLWDKIFRDALLGGIARLGLDLERLLGAAQDIEGAVVGGRLYVVQTRPQVGLG